LCCNKEKRFFGASFRRTFFIAKGGISMDYKTLYKKMFGAVTEAIMILQEAQIECEKMYIDMGEDDDNMVKQFKLVNDNIKTAERP
jgi:hypothetical protein